MDAWSDFTRARENLALAIGDLALALASDPLPEAAIELLTDSVRRRRLEVERLTALHSTPTTQCMEVDQNPI